MRKCVLSVGIGVGRVLGWGQCEGRWEMRGEAWDDPKMGSLVKG